MGEPTSAGRFPRAPKEALDACQIRLQLRDAPRKCCLLLLHGCDRGRRAGLGLAPLLVLVVWKLPLWAVKFALQSAKFFLDLLGIYLSFVIMAGICLIYHIIYWTSRSIFLLSY